AARPLGVLFLVVDFTAEGLTLSVHVRDCLAVASAVGLHIPVVQGPHAVLIKRTRREQLLRHGSNRPGEFISDIHVLNHSYSYSIRRLATPDVNITEVQTTPRGDARKIELDEEVVRPRSLVPVPRSVAVVDSTRVRSVQGNCRGGPSFLP